MRYKKYILNNLLLPVFACLLAGLAGCSNEVVPQDEGDNPDNSRRSSFSVSVRGVVTGNATDASGLYEDDYVHSIRILAFDSNGAVKYNQLFESEANTTSGALAWTNATSTEIIIDKQELSLERGNYTFYFIANEKGHTLADDATANSLAEQLKDKDENLPLTLNDLKAIKVTYADPSADKPILMTAEKTVSIIPGVDVNISNVKLVRTIAKVELQIRKSADNSITDYEFSDVKITGKIPVSFSLLFNENEKYTLSGDDQLVNMTGLTDVTNGSLATYIAYLPERMLTYNSLNTNALDIQFTSKYYNNTNTTTYNNREILIGEDSSGNEGEPDVFDIERNKYYTIIATLTKSTPVFEFITNEWEEKRIEVEFGVPEYNTNNVITPTAATADVYLDKCVKKTDADDTTYWEFTPRMGEGETAIAGGRLEIPFHLTAPKGARWVATFTAMENDEFTLTNFTGRTGEDKTIIVDAMNRKENAQECVLQIMVNDMPLRDDNGEEIKFRFRFADDNTTQP